MYYKFNKETLLPEKVNVTNKTLTGVGVAIGLLLVLGFTSKPKDKVQDLTPEEKLIVVREYNGFTEKALIEKIKGKFKLFVPQNYQLSLTVQRQQPKAI